MNEDIHTIVCENQNKKSYACIMCTTNTVLDILKIFSFMLGFPTWIEIIKKGCLWEEPALDTWH